MLPQHFNRVRVTFCQVLRFSIAVDWLTFVFMLANFGALGSFAVFFTAPSIVKQGYLVCVSVIMAWSLSKLPDWTNWTILIALAVYDLFAVLSPCGPLKALVEMSQSRNEAIPGLVYEADAPEIRSPSASRAPAPSDFSHETPRPVEVLPRDDSDAHVDAGPRLRGRPGSGGAEGGAVEMQQVAQADASAAGGEARDDEDDAEVGGGEEEQDSGVKLGLGDFVFYSVLVARCVAFSLFHGGCIVSRPSQSRFHQHDRGRHNIWRHRFRALLHFGAVEHSEPLRAFVLSNALFIAVCSIKRRSRPCPSPFFWA
jgi:presenilin 1